MKKRGFTLVELLVVVFIIGILASVVLVATSSARSKSRDDKRKIDVDTIAQAAEMYYANKRFYPCKGLCNNIISNSNWAGFQSDLGSFVTSWPDNIADFSYGISSSGKKMVVEVKLERTYNVTTDCALDVDTIKSSDTTCKASDNSYHYRRVSQ